MPVRMGADVEGRSDERHSSFVTNVTTRAVAGVSQNVGRIAIGAALTGVGVLVARAFAPKLHARLMAKCERMFEQMPDSFPPKQMLRGIEEIRANTARTLALLEESAPAGRGEPSGLASSTGTVHHRA